MKHGWGSLVVCGVFAGFGVLGLTGCGEMGNTPVGQLPRDVHAAPDTREVGRAPVPLRRRGPLHLEAAPRMIRRRATRRA